MILFCHFPPFAKAASFSDTLYLMYTQMGKLGAASGQFYKSLALLETICNPAAYQMSWFECHRRLRIIHNHLKVFWYWAKHCPENTIGKLSLIQAKLTWYHGNTLNATTQFFCVIVHAQNGGILLEDALANERAGKYAMEFAEKGREATFSSSHHHHHHGRNGQTSGTFCKGSGSSGGSYHYLIQKFSDIIIIILFTMSILVLVEYSAFFSVGTAPTNDISQPKFLLACF